MEAVLEEVRSDVRDVRTELERARARLHDLEGISNTFLAWQKKARQDEQEQYRRLGFRIQVLTVVVGLAAVLTPIIAVFVTGK